MTLRFYDGGSFKLLAAKPLVHWFFVLACLAFRALLLPFAVDMDSYLVLATTDLTSTSMTMTTWVPTTMSGSISQCLRDEDEPCDLQCTEHLGEDRLLNICSDPWRTHHNSSQSMSQSQSLKLTFCNWRTFHSLGNNHYGCVGLNMSQENCSKCLEDVLRRDCELRDMYEEYVTILEKFDCGIDYSMYNCVDCKEMYKDWLCATQLPYYDSEGRRVKPCLEHCRWARRKCPYLLPHKTYCGQQTFICPEDRDLLFGKGRNTTYAIPGLSCMDCNHEKDHHNNKEGPCTSEFIRTPRRSHANSIHSIPTFAITMLGCLISLILSRTLCIHCLS